MSLPPIFPAAFYRLLANGAQKLGTSRAKLATDAVRHYLKAQDTKNAPIAKVLPEDLAKHFADARRKIAKNWWDKLSDEEKAARAKKANQARWKDKHQPS